MKKLQLMILCLLISILIIGYTGYNIDSQSVKVGKLLFNHNQIRSIEVVKGTSEEKMVVLNDSDISMLISKVKEITVKKLTKDQDDNFMPRRIVDETKLHVYFYGKTNVIESLNGEFFIWPDGYVYVVDVNSMKENQRTISYLSESKYSDIYEWLNEKI